MDYPVLLCHISQTSFRDGIKFAPVKLTKHS